MGVVLHTPLREIQLERGDLTIEFTIDQITAADAPRTGEKLRLLIVPFEGGEADVRIVEVVSTSAGPFGGVAGAYADHQVTVREPNPLDDLPF